MCLYIGMELHQLKCVYKTQLLHMCILKQLLSGQIAKVAAQACGTFRAEETCRGISDLKRLLALPSLLAWLTGLFWSVTV